MESPCISFPPKMKRFETNLGLELDLNSDFFFYKELQVKEREPLSDSGKAQTTCRPERLILFFSIRCRCLNSKSSSRRDCSGEGGSIWLLEYLT